MPGSARITNIAVLPSRTATATAIDRHASVFATRSFVPSKVVVHNMLHLRIWKKSVGVLMGVMRNSAWSVLLVPTINLVLSFGDVFSSKSSQQQSVAEFVSGVTATAVMVFAGCALGFHVVLLRRLHFVDAPTVRPSILKCVWRLLVWAWKGIVAGVVLWVGGTYALGVIDESNITTRKIHLYVGLVSSSAIVLSFQVISKSVFQRETVEGQATGTVNRSPYWKRAWQTIRRHKTFHIGLAMSTVYVHVSSSLNVSGSDRDIIIFAVSSAIFKIFIQMYTKKYLERHDLLEPVTTYASVMLPSVFIETQLRICLLRFQRSSSASGSAQTLQAYVFGLLGFVELGIRVMKLLYLRKIIGPSRTVQPIRLTMSMQRRPRAVNTMTWREKKLFLFAAGTLADMYAEYVAILCSSSVYFFFEEHPKYYLSGNLPTNPDVPNLERIPHISTDRLVALMRSLVIQVVTEIAVDFVCCVMEFANGVPLTPAKDMDNVLQQVIIHDSNLNVCLCAFGYVRAAFQAS